MEKLKTKVGIESRMIQTDRLKIHALLSGKNRAKQSFFCMEIFQLRPTGRI